MTSEGVGLNDIRVNIYTSAGYVTSVRTNSSGAYTLPDIAPGTYKIQFYDRLGNYQREWFDNQANFATANAILVTAGGTVTANADLAATAAATT